MPGKKVAKSKIAIKEEKTLEFWKKELGVK